MHQQLQTQLIQSIKEDLSTPILRYYLQEEAFLCDPKTPQSLFELPFNQIAAEVVAEVTLSNKQITNNSRVAANLLENGKEIFRNKKLEYFNSFKGEYKLIGEALQSLGIQQRSVFQYSVMAISNLILKLSLNMSRISIIMIAKLFTVPVLNPFITAILFQKFLQKQHLRSKEASRKQEDHLHLLKQFPKISIIKLSQKRNPFERQYINNSQRLFGTQANNVQFIQLYQKEGEYANFYENLDRRDSYNMRELFGLTFPFGMQFYLFFSQIIVPKIQNYKPDIVIYYEDLPCELESGVNPEIKGLIINIISQKIQNKIYVFKQFGLTPDSPILKSPQQIEQQALYINTNIQKASNLWTTHDQDLNSHIQKQNLAEMNVKELIKKDCIEMNKINQRVAKARQQQITAKKMALLNFKIQKTETKNLDLELSIKNMRRLLFDDLTYISLGLLQKENFQNLNNTFRNYTFPSLFLGKFINWIKGQVQDLSKTKNFSDQIIALQKKVYMLEGMLQISELSSDEATKVQTNYFTFYNFITMRAQTVSESVNNEVKAIIVGKNDQSYYHYTKTHVFLFLFSTSAKIYAKRYNDAHFVCLREDKFDSQQSKRLAARHSTLVSNNKYFYKAFGQYEEPSIKESYICYLNIESIEKIQHKQTVKWEFIKECKHGTGNVKMEQKKYGWGTSIDLKEGNLVILGGGYNFRAENEEKVNKFLYIISKDKEVEKIGKISPQKTNLQENLKCKNIIFPCVYGVPLAYSKGELIVLNTNGYYQKFNHLKKMFVTRIKVAAKNQIYVIGQSKMDYIAKRTEEAIANKNSILSLMIGSYNQISRHQDVTSLRDSEGNIHLLKVEEYESKDKVRVQSVAKETPQMCEEDTVYQISFERSRLVLKQDENKLFMKRVVA